MTDSYNAANNISLPESLPAALEAREFQDLVNEAMYESEEFRMYGYKARQCPNLGSHDWTSCPFAHHGEKARRRDPRTYNYVAIPCPEFKKGECWKGEACQFAHGIFEYWLHPAKYRTRPCNAGSSCERKICFFAHSERELRTETKYKWCYFRLPVQSQSNTVASTGGVVFPNSPQPQPQIQPQGQAQTLPQPVLASHARSKDVNITNRTSCKVAEGENGT